MQAPRRRHGRPDRSAHGGHSCDVSSTRRPRSHSEARLRGLISIASLVGCIVGCKTPARAPTPSPTAGHSASPADSTTPKSPLAQPNTPPAAAPRAATAADLAAAASSEPSPPGGTIATAVKRQRGAVTRCYVKVARQDRALARRKLTFDVDFVVGVEGRVITTQVAGLGPSRLEQALGQCVVAVFKRMRFPAQRAQRRARQHYSFTAGPRR